MVSPSTLGSRRQRCSELLHHHHHHHLLHRAQVLGSFFPPATCCNFPHLTDWRMTEKNQFWNHYLREQHKLFFLFFLFFHFTTISHGVIKSRTDDSIHSWSSASKVESRWHHWRCELVSAVFLDHLGFCNKMGNIFFNKIKQQKTVVCSRFTAVQLCSSPKTTK